MVFNRFGAKLSAKLSIRNAHPRPFLVTAVYVILTVYLTNLLLGLVGDSFSEALYYIQSGYEIEEVIRYVFFHDTGKTAVFLLLQLALSIYGSVMDYGYTSYTMKLARNQTTGYRDLFNGFSRLGRVVLMNILLAVFSGLWTVLCMIPASIILMIMVFGGAFNMILMSLYWLLAVAGIVTAIFIVYRYRLAVFFLVDDSDCTALDAIRRSKSTMKGHVAELFLLDVSFIGWLLLAVLTMGIFSLWVSPYMGATYCNFYDSLTNIASDSSTYTGPMYEIHVQPDSDHRHNPF